MIRRRHYTNAKPRAMDFEESATEDNYDFDIKNQSLYVLQSKKLFVLQSKLQSKKLFSPFLFCVCIVTVSNKKCLSVCLSVCQKFILVANFKLILLIKIIRDYSICSYRSFLSHLYSEVYRYSFENQSLKNW